MAWGLYHGVGLIVLRLYGLFVYNKLPVAVKESKSYVVGSTLLTFNFVVLGWIFFVTDFDQSIYLSEKMFMVG